MKHKLARLAVITIAGLFFADATYGQQYIQNQTNLQQNANFNIDGVGSSAVFNAGKYYEIGGRRVLLANPFPEANVFVGIDAGASNATGFNNSFIGFNAGKSNKTGNANAFLGWSAGENNITGRSNTFVGSGTGRYNATGSNNSFYGVGAGTQNTTAEYNSFFGAWAGRDTTSGTINSFFGAFAGQSNTLGQRNVFLGYAAGLRNTTGSDNVFIGTGAGENHKIGRWNTLVGRWAGSNNHVGISVSLFGSKTDTGSVDLEYATAVGAEATVLTNNTVQLGRHNLDKIRVGTLTNAGKAPVCINGNNELAFCSSSKRYKTDISDLSSGLGVIEQLHPVSFRWKSSKSIDLGLVAEDVAQVAPGLVSLNPSGKIEGVKYEKIGLILVNAVKEQQALIEKQAIEIKSLKKLICSTKQDPAICG